MTDEFKKWFFEELIYSPRLQLPKHLGRMYLGVYDELLYLHTLRPPIDKLPEVAEQRKELEEKAEGIENELTEYFKNNLPRLLTRKYLDYLQSLQGKVNNDG